MATVVLKLIVEVVDARNLLPKDGHGRSSPYVILDYHGQRRKTKTVIDNLNPTWNETLKFNVAKTPHVFGDLLELKVLHDIKFGPTTRNRSLGKAELNCKLSDEKRENLSYYALRKNKCCMSYIIGQIGLKISFAEEVVPPPPAPNPPPTVTPQPPQNTQTPPPYQYPYPCPYPCAWENIVPNSPEEQSYPGEESYPTVSLTSILIAFQLCLFLICFIRC